MIGLLEVDLARDPGGATLGPGGDGGAVLATWKGVPVGEFRLTPEESRQPMPEAELARIALQRSGWKLWDHWAAGVIEDLREDELPPISVVVCTRDRAGLLAGCLAALGRLDYPRYEVVVVDNGSRDPEVRQIILRSGFRYVWEERAGLDWARNRGAAEARHAIVSYIDDDARAAKGWLRGVARGFRHPEAMMVTGLILPAELTTEAQRLFEVYGGMSKGLVRRVFRGAEMSVAEKLAAHHYGVGANLSFRREVFERVGPFDTALDVGTPSFGAGDLDMIHRVLVAGMTIVYEPSATIRHRHRPDFDGLRRQIYANGRAYGVYLLKNLRNRTVPRGPAARYALDWFARWVCARSIRGILGWEALPTSLLLAELEGAIHAPRAYFATMRHDRRMRSAS